MNLFVSRAFSLLQYTVYKQFICKKIGKVTLQFHNNHSFLTTIYSTAFQPILKHHFYHKLI